MNASLTISVQNLQGVLIVTLRNSVSGMPLDDNEVRRRFQMFGDVKSVELPPDGRLKYALVLFHRQSSS